MALRPRFVGLQRFCNGAQFVLLSVGGWGGWTQTLSEKFISKYSLVFTGLNSMDFTQDKSEKQTDRQSGRGLLTDRSWFLV